MRQAVSGEVIQLSNFLDGALDKIAPRRCRGGAARVATALRALRRAVRWRAILFRLHALLAQARARVSGLRVAHGRRRGMRPLPRECARSPQRWLLSPTRFPSIGSCMRSSTADASRSRSGPPARSSPRSGSATRLHGPTGWSRCRCRASPSVSAATTRPSRSPACSPASCGSRSFATACIANAPHRRRPRRRGASVRITCAAPSPATSISAE
jgi:hypothetical protein